MNKKNKIGLIITLAGCVAGNLMAGNLASYATGDVLLCFRNGGTYDLVVDAGPVSTLTSLAANQRYTISAYMGVQLHYVGTNSMSWSAFAWQGDNTLFMTAARASLNSQTTPWLKQTAQNQLGTIQRVQSIPLGAVDNLGQGLNNLNSTSTAVIEEDSSVGNPNYLNGVSYADDLNVNSLNFNNTFQGNPENTTLANFTKSGQVVRSDFYQLTPASSPYGSQKGVLMGYFELNTNGVMTYVAYPSSTPAFTSISRAGNVNTISYTTGLYGTYTLRGTNSAGLTAAQTNWPAIGSPLTSGDTAVHTVQDTTTDANKFYTITAQ